MNAPDLIKEYWDNLGEQQPEVRRSPRLKKTTTPTTATVTDKKNKDNMKISNAAGAKTFPKPAEHQQKKNTSTPKLNSEANQKGGDCKDTESRQSKKPHDNIAYAMSKHDPRPSKTPNRILHTAIKISHFTCETNTTETTTSCMKPHTRKTVNYLPRITK